MFETVMEREEVEVEGTTDDRPIAPQGISSFEFTSFLAILTAR